MANRRIKKSVFYGVYVLGLVALVATIYLIESITPKKQFKLKDYSYVSKTIFDDVIPVLATEDKILKPYSVDDVQIIKSYYDFKGEEKQQEQSIINYKNTYMQSSGVSYGKENEFDIISVLPGTVEDIKDDELLGKIIKVKHNDNVTSVYQCLNNSTIQKGDSVIAGQVIGKSGNCSLEKNIKNNVYFELIINNNYVNPENYYGKSLKEIEI